VNYAAELTLESLRAHYAAAGPYYSDALITACRKAPPPFGTKKYEKIYRDVAKDPTWMAMSLIQNAQGEGEGSEHLWDLAASTPDARVAAHVKAHAIDESRHAKAYLAMLDLTFPDVVDNELRPQLNTFSPGYTQRSPLEAHAGSPYASAVTLDDLIQMNIAEIRTLVHHLIQRPMLLAYCVPERRHRLALLHDRLRIDEARHIGYTAALIEEFAQRGKADAVKRLMQERMSDFNAITNEDLGRGAFKPDL
jgi:rubrerythrin